MSIIQRLKNNIDTLFLSNKYYYEIYTKSLDEIIQTENIYVIQKKLEQKNVIQKKSLDIALYTNNIEIIKLIIMNGGKITNGTQDLCIILENTEIIKMIKCIDKYNFIYPYLFFRILATNNEECIKTYIALYDIYFYFEDNTHQLLYKLEEINFTHDDYNNNIIKLVLMHLYTNDIQQNLKILQKYNIIMTEKEFIIYYNKNIKDFNSIINNTINILPIKDIIYETTNIIPDICDIILKFNFPKWNLI